MKAVTFSLFFLLLFSLSGLPAGDPAQGHFESALFLLQNQKYQQAVDDFNLIVKSFPQSPIADDALLQLAIYYLNLEKKPEEALGYLQQIKERYPESNSAPAAYFYLGSVYLAKRDPASLDEAFANFQRVTLVYSSSPWVDDALVGAGMVLRFRGEFDKAYEEYSRVKLRFPDSRHAPRAQYEMGLCSLYADRITEAMDQFQKVNVWYPGSDYAKSATEMNTILYRIYIVPPSSNIAYAPDSRFSGTVMELDEPTGLSMDSKQNIYLSDKGKKTVTIFDAAGRQTNTISLFSPYSVSIDDQDRAFIANGTNVIATTPTGNDTIFLSTNVVDSGGTAARLEDIRSVAIDETGKLFVVSSKVNGILVYGPNSKPLAGYAFSQTLKPFSKVLVNARNQILALDKDRKQLSVYGADGKFLFTIGPTGKGYTLERVEDFAVDRANHIYLLERNPRSILVFSPSGNLQKYILSQKKGTLSFDDARLITVGPSGSIYVLDKDSHRIIKIG